MVLRVPKLTSWVHPCLLWLLGSRDFHWIGYTHSHLVPSMGAQIFELATIQKKIVSITGFSGERADIFKLKEAIILCSSVIF